MEAPGEKLKVHVLVDVVLHVDVVRAVDGDAPPRAPGALHGGLRSALHSALQDALLAVGGDVVRE